MVCSHQAQGKTKKPSSPAKKWRYKICCVSEAVKFFTGAKVQMKSFAFGIWTSPELHYLQKLLFKTPKWFPPASMFRATFFALPHDLELSKLSHSMEYPLWSCIRNITNDQECSVLESKGL